MENKKIAIDIVLTLPEEVIWICKEINKDLDSKIDFTNTWKIPHISILMWVIEEKDINTIKEKILNIYNNIWKIEIRWIIEDFLIPERNDNTPYINFEKNEKISRLYSKIKEELSNYITYNIEKNMFYTPDKIDDFYYKFIKSYENKTEEEFSWHITLWFWKIPEYIWKEFSFKSENIKIFQLWNYCTCENELY